MKKIFEIGIKAMNLAMVYPKSLYGGYRDRKLFEDVGAYCMFIGYPRSGHSLIGALLDAHPDMIIAHELGVLEYVHAGFSKRQIYHLLLERSQLFEGGRKKRVGYSYEVSNQWQGRYKKIQIIGDKHGEGAILRLRARPWLLQRLRNVTDERIKFIHVLRNPYDIITALYKLKDRRMGMGESIEYYFSLCKTVMDIKNQIKDEYLFELRHELFIDSPKTHLKEICLFLGIDAPNDYLNDCASIVFKTPHKRRYDTKWSRELIDIVKDRIDEFPFLHGYSYEN